MCPRTLVRAGQPDIVQVEGICANFNAGAADRQHGVCPHDRPVQETKSNRSYPRKSAGDVS
ncbi:hypothetical protein EMIT0111MI5_10586 [Burkholderia sp. IT-111MI5]